MTGLLVTLVVLQSLSLIINIGIHGQLVGTKNSPGRIVIHPSSAN